MYDEDTDFEGLVIDYEEIIMDESREFFAELLCGSWISEERIERLRDAITKRIQDDKDADALNRVLTARGL